MGRGTIESEAKRVREWGERGEREKTFGVIGVRSGVRERGSGARGVRESVARGVREWGKMV